MYLLVDNQCAMVDGGEAVNGGLRQACCLRCDIDGQGKANKAKQGILPIGGRNL